MPTLSLPLIILVAVAPALIAWWTGRGLLARADDPALPELLLDRQRRLSVIAFGGAVLLAVLFAADALWALALLWIALLVSSYPLRRALFGERWSLFAYLRFTISSGIGRAGLWLLMAFSPAITTSS